ncbi:MAG: hemolysin family protein [Bacteroidales bacterium]|nr:hemolysin family protein [Bacteroidales bacterium]
MTLLLIFALSALGISFLCSILESSLMSTPISYITMREEEGFKPASLMRKYKIDTDRPLAAILSLNTIANTVGSSGVGFQVTAVFGDKWFGLISGIFTLMVLIFSEIIPKTIGTTNYKKLMGFTAKSIRILIIIMYPFVWLINLMSRTFTKNDEEETTVSREEVSAMANVGEDEGVIEESENKIIQNVFKLDNIQACDVMTPRVVAAIADEGMTLRDFYREELFSHFSRIPVYNETADIITGYVLRSEVLESLAEDRWNDTLGTLRRDVPFFNEEQSISEIWESLLQHKEQIAMIIDEYGSFQGILTMEDIIETIFGLEIIDESDEVTDMQQYARERWRQRQRRFQQVPLPDEEKSTDHNNDSSN